MICAWVYLCVRVCSGSLTPLAFSSVTLSLSLPLPLLASLSLLPSLPFSLPPSSPSLSHLPFPLPLPLRSAPLRVERVRGGREEERLLDPSHTGRGPRLPSTLPMHTHAHIFTHNTMMRVQAHRPRHRRRHKHRHLYGRTHARGRRHRLMRPHLHSHIHKLKHKNAYLKQKGGNKTTLVRLRFPPKRSRPVRQ